MGFDMKMDLPKSALVIASVFWISGFLILCECPGWFGISTGFAAVPAFYGKGRVRTWGRVVFGAGLVMTGVHLALKLLN